MTRTLRVLLLCIAAAGLTPARGDAQLGNLIKKKVKAEVSGEKKSDDASKGYKALGIPKGEEQFVTEDAVEDFITGVKESIRLRKELREQLLAYKSPAEYQACQQQFAQSAEIQKIALSMAENLPENPTAEQAKKAQDKMMSDLAAAQKRKCGVDINQEWPIAKRQKRLTEIHEAGHAAFTAAREARTAQPRSGPSAFDFEAGAAGVPQNYYAWLWDVVNVFCKSRKDNLIVKDKNGAIDFGFSSPVPFSRFMTQQAAELLWSSCVWVETHDELLDLLEIQR